MKVKALKPFRYAHDGVHTLDHAEGDEVEIHARHAKALRDGGFIPDDKAVAAAAAKAEAEAKAKADAEAKAKADAEAKAKADAEAKAK